VGSYPVDRPTAAKAPEVGHIGKSRWRSSGFRTVAEVDAGAPPYGCIGRCTSRAECPFVGCWRWEERRIGGRMA
jgi:hypothetical protein